MHAPRREGGSPRFSDLLFALGRALRLRCPQCGRGALFTSRFGFTMHERCPVCGLKWDRGNGYYIGALALNLVLTETVATALWLPLALDRSVPISTVYIVGLGASVGLPILAFRHTRALWIALDRLLNPVS
jgi:uncharacterized protein (DUF983 family)